MVKNLQAKLDDAKNRISELTDVLTHLNSEKTIELYYEESAQAAMNAVLAKQNANNATAAAGSVAGYSQKGKSDMPTGSQITGTNATQRLTKKRF